MHQVTKADAVAAASLWRLAGGCEPVYGEMHHEFMPSGLGRPTAGVITGADTTDLTNDHRLESGARALATAATAACDSATAISAEYPERLDELLVIGRGGPNKEASSQTVRRIGNVILDGLARKESRDHHPRATSHRCNGRLWEFPEFVSQHPNGWLIEIAAFPQSPQCVVRLAVCTFERCITKMID